MTRNLTLTLGTLLALTVALRGVESPAVSAAEPLAVSAVEPLPRSAPDAVGFSPAKLGEATALLQRFVADQKIAGAVAGVARKGKLAYLEAVGQQDLATRSPMTDRSMFRIYSMTKPITAVAVMMLHEEGKFRLDDPVSKYLPDSRT